MCDFHSVVIYADGAMFHVPQNSHSAAVKASGRQENSGEERRFWEWEWDGKGDKPQVAKILRGYDSAPANVIRVAEAHADRLSRALKGDIDPFFVRSEYVDVLLRSPGSVLKGLTIIQGCELWDLTSVTSLDGVKLERDCKLGGLTSVTSLDGVKLERDCKLVDLTSVTSLDGVKLEQGCELWGLTSVTSLDGVKLEQGCTLWGLRGKAYAQYENWLRTGKI